MNKRETDTEPLASAERMRSALMGLPPLDPARLKGLNPADYMMKPAPEAER
jgi:hypothetical protein